MPFKPNYNQQRNDRARAKQAKKAEKLRRKQESAEQRKASDEATPVDADSAPAEDAADDRQ